MRMTESLFADTTSALKDFYITIGSLQDDALQQRICQAMDMVIASWKKRHERLDDAVMALQEQISLAQEEKKALSRRLSQAVRESTFYRTRFEAQTSLMALSVRSSSTITPRKLSMASSDLHGRASPALSTTALNDDDIDCLLDDPSELLAFMDTQYPSPPKDALHPHDLPLPPQKDPPPHDRPLPPIIDTTRDAKNGISDDHQPDADNKDAEKKEDDSLSAEISLLPSPPTTIDLHLHATIQEEDEESEKEEQEGANGTHGAAPLDSHSPESRSESAPDVSPPPPPPSPASVPSNETVSTAAPPPQKTKALSPFRRLPPFRRRLSTINDNLQFACGDGFWYTLANGLGEKEQVDLLIKNYLRRGGKVNVANNSGDYKTLKEGDGLIHALILARNTQCLQRILELGANPSALPLRENDGEYPLILAARLGYMNAVRLLVERACVDVMSCKGPGGMSVLHAATMTDSLELFEYLVRISERQLLHEIDAKGATVLHYACKSGFLRLITYLVRDCGLPPDMADSKGETPLHYAIRSMRAKTVVKLVSHLGAQVNPYVYKQVMTPYELARAGGLHPIADYLKKKGGKSSKDMEKEATAAAMALPTSSTVSPVANSSSLRSSAASSLVSVSSRSSSAVSLPHDPMVQTGSSLHAGSSIGSTSQRPLSVSGISTRSTQTTSSSNSSNDSILSHRSNRSFLHGTAAAVKSKLDSLMS